MEVKVAGIEKKLTPKVVSEGQEHLINLAFVLSLGMFVFDNKLPYFFADDVVAFQSNETAKEVVLGLIDLQKQGYIGQLYLSSNRLKDLKLNNYADRIVEFVDTFSIKMEIDFSNPIQK